MRTNESVPTVQPRPEVQRRPWLGLTVAAAAIAAIIAAAQLKESEPEIVQHSSTQVDASAIQVDTAPQPVKTATKAPPKPKPQKVTKRQRKRRRKRSPAKAPTKAPEGYFPVLAE